MRLWASALLDWLVVGGIFPLFFDLLPAGIRIVFRPTLGMGLGLFSEVFLINHSIRANDECHHSRRPVFRRIGHKSETLSHFAIDDVVLRPAVSSFSLTRENAVKVAAERSRDSVLVFWISLGDSGADEGANRTLGFAVCGLPIKAIMLSFIAEDFLRVLVMLRSVVFFLRRRQLPANYDRRHLIAPDAPEQNFFLGRARVEIPHGPFVHQWDWRRPILGANVQSDRSIRFSQQTVHFLIFLYEDGAVVAVLGVVSRGNDLLFVWSKDREHDFFVIVPGSHEQRIARFVRGRKCFLP